MATTYANNKRKSVESITNPRTMVSVAEQGGRMRVMYDTYEAEGNSPTDENNTGANGTIVVVGTLPKGARIWNIMLQADALGSSVTLSAGYGAHTNSDTDASVSQDLVAFSGATAMNTAKKVFNTAWDSHTAQSIDNTGFECVDENGTNIIIDIDGGHATGTIKTAIFYTVD